MELSCSLVSLSRAVSFFCTHFKAKWFFFWQEEQVFPKAGLFDLSFSCAWPQNRQSFTKDDLSVPLDGFLTKVTSEGGCACEFYADMASNWVAVVLSLRHISIHLSSVSSGTWSSFFLKLLSRIPHPILSLMISSLSAPKLHVSEMDLKFDAWVSIDSPASWSRLLKLSLNNVSIPRQQDSHNSRIFAKFFFSASLWNGKPLWIVSAFGPIHVINAATRYSSVWAYGIQRNETKRKETRRNMARKLFHLNGYLTRYILKRANFSCHL